MNMIDVTIQGTTPLLINRFCDEAQMAATRGNSETYKPNRAPAEEALTRLYTDENGVPVMPQPNILRCITDAGKFFKVGKGRVSNAKSSLVPACVSLNDVHYPIRSEHGWTVDQRPIRNPSTGGRVLRFRPMFHDWAISFKMLLDEEIISEALLRDLLDTAGKRIGLGDFRPDCKGPFGKFVITNWNFDKTE
jgi:hypothetical protein